MGHTWHLRAGDDHWKHLQMTFGNTFSPHCWLGMRNPTSQGFPRCTNAAAAATEISTGRVELVKIEDLLAAVAWLEPLLRHQDALSRRISGCPGSCARSQLSSGIEQSPPPFPTDGEEQKGTKLFASRQKKKNPFGLSFALPTPLGDFPPSGSQQASQR